MVPTMDQDIITDFLECLEFLQDSDPWFIEELTKLATNLPVYASEIVEAIEQHVQRVQQELKLPALYLVDSIIKNSHKLYIGLFAKNLVDVFFSAFEFADSDTRGMMFRLRKTWSLMFPIAVLYSLDEKIHKFDQGWPITATPPSSARSPAVPPLESLDLSVRKPTPRQNEVNNNKIEQKRTPRPNEVNNNHKVEEKRTPGIVKVLQLPMSGVAVHAGNHERSQETCLSALSLLSVAEQGPKIITPKKRKKSSHFTSPVGKKARIQMVPL